VDFTDDENFDDADLEDDEDEVDEELMLPDVLSSISFHEKKELLIFKRSHNEVSAFVYSVTSKMFYNIEERSLFNGVLNH
jgi:hypothetical protein